MVHRRGEFSSARVDREWPHQVALPASASLNGVYETIHEFCKSLSLCLRGRTACHEDQWFNVYCFSDPADVDKFMQRFGGEKFDPKQKGKGSDWARWEK
jgi:hypothetical protein